MMTHPQAAAAMISAGEGSGSGAFELA